MNTRGVIILLITYFAIMSEESFSQEKLQYYDLTKVESYVINNKGTESPFTGKFTNYKGKGTYVCKKCGAALYYSSDKFESDCGWPSDFVEAQLEPGRYGIAIFAGGCFWGVEYFLQKAKGIISVTSGYTGGQVKNPTYKEVCTGNTGHAEAIKIVYDPDKTSYEKLLKLFLEIHDPTQIGRQGPDIGDQYRSEIFYMNEDQKNTAEKNLNILKAKGLKIATALTKASEFYPAEAYHQDYYFNNGKVPYCHAYTKRF
ncbi:MAG: peptide-methionine (S)-S-oxide reductase MsrA [Bacteroidales bacterium]